MAIGAFVFVMFAIVWAWINFSWFSSAFDTDDWLFRLMTMVQMAGVIVLTLGIPDVFKSLEEGHHVDNRVLVAGYIVMRVALVAQWLRVAISTPEYRKVALNYAVPIFILQVFWAFQAFMDFPLVPALVLVVIGGLAEITIRSMPSGPVSG